MQVADDSVSPFESIHRSKWLESVVTFIQETQASTLDLSDQYLDADDLKALTKYLPNSELTELILGFNFLPNGMKDLAEILPKTNITKLDVSNCELSFEDVFHLLEVLKDTKINELHMYHNFSAFFNRSDGIRFNSLILHSHLKIFNADLHPLDPEGENLFFRVLPRTTITQLHGDQYLNYDNYISLFSRLHRSSLTELILQDIEFDEYGLEKLSQSLRISKLKLLRLERSNINDDGVDILVEGLVDSEVTHLDLTSNKIRGSTALGLRLEDMCITTLNISGNNLDQYGIFMCPEFLRNSSVSSLDVSDCHLDEHLFQKLLKNLRFSKVTNLNVGFNDLQLPAITNFAKILKDTNLERVNFQGNDFPSDALVILGECVKHSKLSHLNLSNCFEDPNVGTVLPVFLKTVYSCNDPNDTRADAFTDHLENATLINLDFSSNNIGSSFESFPECLKFTALTSLCLNSSKITDEGLEALVEHIKETQLVELLLRYNLISGRGTKALARCLEDSSLLYVDLSCNKIESDGIEALAQGAEGTFITVLKVSSSTDLIGVWIVDAVLLRNKLAVQRLVNTFKLISPQADSNQFNFDSGMDCQNVHTFLENCLQVYMNVMQKPSAVSVLVEEKSIAFHKEQIISLMSEEFPKQFCQFVASRVEANVTQHVSILKSAEDKGLDKIVELLLLNRPSYLIDENQGILHPHVYDLLNKYSHPLYNLAVEPNAKVKIISYFTEHPEIEGVSDVISLLRGKRKL